MQLNIDLHIQTLIGLLTLVICLVFVVLGYLLYRFEFLDGKSFFFSRSLGKILMIISAILAVVVIFMLIYVRLRF